MKQRPGESPTRPLGYIVWHPFRGCKRGQILHHRAYDTKREAQDAAQDFRRWQISQNLPVWTLRILPIARPV